MIYLNLPVGVAHGWGVCGSQIAREMSHVAQTRLFTDAFAVGDELELAHLRTLLPREAMNIDPARLLDGPLLQLANKQLQPMRASLRGQFTLGYTFFEDTELQPAYIETARSHFDVMSAGSRWCADILRAHGLTRVETVLQGVDRTIFHPVPNARQLFRDRFVVFSGGKFEFRKGHDIVIRAFKVLQDRHPDAMLVVSWRNQWPFSYRSMRQSKHIKFDESGDGSVGAIMQVIVENGIDPARVIPLELRAHHALPQVYHNSDVGIFPNRAEGGTNLVLMEYMACGKPVIATASTGHADVVKPDRALIIGTGEEIISSSDGVSIARWPEPNLEEAIEQLEFAYQNRDRLREMGTSAARAMAELSWKATTERFFKLLTTAGQAT